MSQVISRDGTRIAYTKNGHGPVIIIVNGAMGYRDYYGDKELAQELSKEFTVIIYDRRGRGESCDTLPYAVEREIEDIDALINVSNSQVDLYGVSSGAVLALKATVKLVKKVNRLAMYEPPCNMDETAEEEFVKSRRYLNELLETGRRSDAVALFLSNFMTPAMIDEFRKTNAGEWKIMEAVAPTLAYDYAIMGDCLSSVEDARTMMVPTLLMNGSMGLPVIGKALDFIAGTLPNAKRKILEGQSHGPAAEALAPELRTFFNNISKH